VPVRSINLLFTFIYIRNSTRSVYHWPYSMLKDHAAADEWLQQWRHVEVYNVYNIRCVLLLYMAYCDLLSVPLLYRNF